MTDFKGYKIIGRNGRNHWAPLCEEWLLLIERYIRLEKNHDASYWFNEMADVAVLAGAAWRCGWIGLPETQIEKGARHRPKHWGRADLYLANDTLGEYVEAKHRKVSMRGNVVGVFEEGLAAAISDARSTSGRDQLEVTGLCFFALKYPKSQVGNDKMKLENSIRETIEEARGMKSHVTAWCFPERSRLLDDEDGYVWPGTILMASNPDYL